MIRQSFLTFQNSDPEDRFKHCNVAGTPNLPQERRRFVEAGDDMQISLRETRREQPFGNRLRVLLAHENGDIRVAADFPPKIRG